MANRLQRLDVALARCYENDLNWTILPEKLYEVIIWPIIFMNQTKLSGLRFSNLPKSFRARKPRSFAECLPTGIQFSSILAERMKF